MSTIVRVDIFSDIACPFCFIGDTRLERVRTAFPELQFDWNWHPFQLQPTLPERGMPWNEFSVQKFGGLEARRSAFAHVIQAGQIEGITFDFETMPVAPNTLNAHRLVLFASKFGLGKPVALALYKAYFSRAKDITNINVLEQLALSVGLELSLVRLFLQSSDLSKEVQDSQLEAQRLGISGVPFFIFDQRLAISGAQPTEVFEQLMQRFV
jgi:predicted DsbA family dithiol-disulfide isomerase